MKILYWTLITLGLLWMFLVCLSAMPFWLTLVIFPIIMLLFALIAAPPIAMFSVLMSAAISLTIFLIKMGLKAMHRVRFTA